MSEHGSRLEPEGLIEVQFADQAIHRRSAMPAPDLGEDQARRVAVVTAARPYLEGNQFSGFIQGRGLIQIKRRCPTLE
ncbi:hypothetical protein BMS3Bbin12_01119 [bacterium BMS3Bbin12]|nr:hypothetical protein BMS3Abin12_01754 [bacterium BMS3Abin12]GBE47950.1 hypothetical protein BMS3Bbin12_01119 [bacterium BMS3Bbin12]GBE49396.1 hypothetical protein BMS3Bbin13_00315 [bacterium BMS3Bbin13]